MLTTYSAPGTWRDWPWRDSAATRENRLAGRPEPNSDMSEATVTIAARSCRRAGRHASHITSTLSFPCTHTCAHAAAAAAAAIAADDDDDDEGARPRQGWTPRRTACTTYETKDRDKRKGRGASLPLSLSLSLSLISRRRRLVRPIGAALPEMLGHVRVRHVLAHLGGGGV